MYLDIFSNKNWKKSNFTVIFSMKNYKPFVMKLIQIIKTPSFHFVKKTNKTFTNITNTRIMMILLFHIKLFNQWTNKWAINMSSHNLKLDRVLELTFLSRYDIFYCFLSIILVNTRHKTDWYGITSWLFATLVFG